MSSDNAKQKIIWTRELVIEEAKKYQRKVDFKRNCSGGYQAAIKKFRGLIDELFVNVYTPISYWTEETISTEAAKYKRKSDLKKNNLICYRVAHELFPGLLDKLFGTKSIRKHINIDTVKLDASACKTRMEFKKLFSGSYKYAVKNCPELLDELFGRVNVKPGYWTIETITEAAKEHKTKWSFGEGNKGAYQAALKHKGLLDNLFTNVRKTWLDEELVSESKKYKSKKDMETNSNAAYQAAAKRGMLDMLFPISRKTKPAGYWTIERITEESKKYTNKKQMETFSGGAHYTAWKKYPGLLDELFPDSKITMPPGYWTKERIIEEAKNFSSKAEMKSLNMACYSAAIKKHPGLLDTIYTNGQKQRPSGYWTRERLLEETSKYKNKHEFMHNCYGGYHAAKKRFPGLLEEAFTNHMYYGQRNVIYLWCAGADIYKFGVTCDYLKEKRIREVSIKNKFFDNVEIIRMSLVNNAVALETELLKLGEKVEFDEKFDGYSEFRKLTMEELNLAISMIDSARILVAA